MKCPKCGYVSFDYNQVCPKCDKDVSFERGKLHLPIFKPAPLSLLGGLTGAADASHIGLDIGAHDSTISESSMELSPEDSQALEAMEEAFKDSQDIEIGLEIGSDGPAVDFADPTRGEADTEIHDEAPSLDLSLDDSDDISLSLDDLAMEDSVNGEVQSKEAMEDEIVFGSDLSSSETADIGESDVLELDKPEEESGSFDLDDLSWDETEISLEEKTSEEAGDGASTPLGDSTLFLDRDDEDLTPSVEIEEKKDAELSLDLDNLDLELDLEGLDDEPS